MQGIPPSRGKGENDSIQLVVAIFSIDRSTLMILGQRSVRFVWFVLFGTVYRLFLDDFLLPRMSRTFFERDGLQDIFFFFRKPFYWILHVYMIFQRGQQVFRDKILINMCTHLEKAIYTRTYFIVWSV